VSQSLDLSDCQSERLSRLALRGALVSHALQPMQSIQLLGAHGYRRLFHAADSAQPNATFLYLEKGEVTKWALQSLRAQFRDVRSRPSYSVRFYPRNDSLTPWKFINSSPASQSRLAAIVEELVIISAVHGGVVGLFGTAG
jgi:hypothetical protein